jgi:hypothetical protein
LLISSLVDVGTTGGASLGGDSMTGEVDASSTVASSTVTVGRAGTVGSGLAVLSSAFTLVEGS